MLVRNLRGEPKWLSGVVLEKTGLVSYRVQVGDQIWRRHADQLLNREGVIPGEPSQVLEGERDLSLTWDMSSTPTQEIQCPEDAVGEPEASQNPAPVSPLTGSSPRNAVSNRPKHYPSRVRNPPDRLIDKYKLSSEM